MNRTASRRRGRRAAWNRAPASSAACSTRSRNSSALPCRKANCWVAQMLCLCACLHMAWHSNPKSVRYSSFSAVKSLLPHEMVLLQSPSVLCFAGQQRSAAPAGGFNPLCHCRWAQPPSAPEYQPLPGGGGGNGGGPHTAPPPMQVLITCNFLCVVAGGSNSDWLFKHMLRLMYGMIGCYSA